MEKIVKELPAPCYFNLPLPNVLIVVCYSMVDVCRVSLAEPPQKTTRILTIDVFLGPYFV